jgi:hypothetical protein
LWSGLFLDETGQRVGDHLSQRINLIRSHARTSSKNGAGSRARGFGLAPVRAAGADLKPAASVRSVFCSALAGAASC